MLNMEKEIRKTKKITFINMIFNFAKLIDYTPTNMKIAKEKENILPMAKTISIKEKDKIKNLSNIFDIVYSEKIDNRIYKISLILIISITLASIILIILNYEFLLS